MENSEFKALHVYKHTGVKLTINQKFKQIMAFLFTLYIDYVTIASHKHCYIFNLLIGKSVAS